MEYGVSPNQLNPGLGSVPRRSGVVRQCSTERSGLLASLVPFTTSLPQPAISSNVYSL